MMRIKNSKNSYINFNSNKIIHINKLIVFLNKYELKILTYMNTTKLNERIRKEMRKL